MNQPYFGAYSGGFQTLPANAYEMMTAPTKQNAQTIGMVASGIGGIAQKYMDQNAADKAFEQGSAAQFKGIETMSQATGVPMNPELANQYMNIGQMSPQQQAAFQNSLGQEAQRIQNLYNISNQQRQFQQSQQAQGVQQAGALIDAALAGRNQNAMAPAMAPAMPSGQGGMPAYNPLFGY